MNLHFLTCSQKLSRHIIATFQHAGIKGLVSAARSATFEGFVRESQWKVAAARFLGFGSWVGGAAWAFHWFEAVGVLECWVGCAAGEGMVRKKLKKVEKIAKKS